MSHDHTTPNRPSTASTPQHRQRQDYEGPPPQPSTWLDQSFQRPEPQRPEHQDSDDLVVIEDDDPGEAPAERGAHPRRRQQLPYGRGFVMDSRDTGHRPLLLFMATRNRGKV